MPTNLKNKPIFLVVVATLHNEYCVKYSILGDNDLYIKETFSYILAGYLKTIIY